jgi:hypothetical protein
LGLLPGELAPDPPNVVPNEDFETMREIFQRLTAGLQCAGVVRNFGNELVLQFGDEEPFSMQIPADCFRTRAQRFESALTEALATRLSR